MKYLKVAILSLLNLVFIAGFSGVCYTLIFEAHSYSPIRDIIVSAILLFIITSTIGSLKTIKHLLSEEQNNDELCDFCDDSDELTTNFVPPKDYSFTRSSITKNQKILHIISWHHHLKLKDAIGLGIWLIIYGGGVIHLILESKITSMWYIPIFLIGIFVAIYYIISLFGKCEIMFNRDSAIYRKRIFFITYWKRTLLRNSYNDFLSEYGELEGSFAKIKVGKKTLLKSQDNDLVDYLVSELSRA